MGYELAVRNYTVLHQYVKGVRPAGRNLPQSDQYGRPSHLHQQPRRPSPFSCNNYTERPNLRGCSPAQHVPLHLHMPDLLSAARRTANVC